MTTFDRANAPDFQVGDQVVLTQPWYRRGRVHVITAIRERFATVRVGSTYTGVSVDDLRPAEGAELLVTPYDLTDEQIAAYWRELPQAESEARHDCFAATREADEVVRFAARERIARTINKRIWHGRR